MQEFTLELRFIKGKFFTMCESCFTIKECYIFDYNIIQPHIKKDTQKVVKNNNVSK